MGASAAGADYNREMLIRALVAGVLGALAFSVLVWAAKEVTGVGRVTTVEMKQ